MSVLVSHSGKQHAYRHALALERRGRLARFLTSAYYKPDRLPDRLVAGWPSVDRVLRRRHQAGLDDRVRRWPWFELPEVLARAALGNGAVSRHAMYLRDAAFDRWVAATQVRAGAADVFWGFQGSCAASLAAARDAGLHAVVELSTGHVSAAERILAAERERHPEWADSLSNAGFPTWYRRRLEAEPHRADTCVVASTFTRETLEEVGVDARRIRVLPLGADLDAITPTARPASGPFRILFVGGVGQRKGIKYLLDAYGRMRTASTRLTVVGPLIGGGRAFNEYRDRVEYRGRLDPARVYDEMARSHVLVLPSLFEGFGLVIIEAMAAGLPVIASTHSAAPDIITDGEHGYVLEPDDVDGLADRLAVLAADARRITAMGRAAAEHAKDFSWAHHEERLDALCHEIETTEIPWAASPALAS
jgi:starch synthase